MFRIVVCREARCACGARLATWRQVFEAVRAGRPVPETCGRCLNGEPRRAAVPASGSETCRVCDRPRPRDASWLGVCRRCRRKAVAALA